MLEAVGHPVKSLTRIRFGPLELGALKPGHSRRLTPAEVDALARAGRG
jgi:23S rRNA pseudouridine2605 synthase